MKAFFTTVLAGSFVSVAILAGFTHANIYNENIDPVSTDDRSTEVIPLSDVYIGVEYEPENPELAYSDNFTTALRRKVALALKLPFTQVGQEFHLREDGTPIYWPIFALPNGTHITVDPYHILLEDLSLVTVLSIGDYYVQNGESGALAADESLLLNRTFAHTERLTWSAPLGNISSCNCVGQEVMLDGKCQMNLETAILSSKAGDVIMLPRNSSLTKPVFFSHDLALVGEDCIGFGKAQLYMNFHHKYHAGLMLSGREEQTLHINNLDVFGGSEKERAEPSFNSFAQAQDYYSWISLQVHNSNFKNFFSAHRGSVFFMWTAGNVTIGPNCTFSHNTVADRREVFGGGAISLGYIDEDSFVHIGGNFDHNAVIYPFPFGSEHGEGGAIFGEYCAGSLVINGTFRDNFASDGGAIHIKSVVNGSLTIDGHFEHNMAINSGAGCRGGAVRVLLSNSPIKLLGTYINNLADTGRGGVFASNDMIYGASLELDGEFKSNTCGSQGGVISQLSEFEGAIILKANSVFEGNVAHGNEDSNILYIRRPSIQRYSEEASDVRFGQLEKSILFV
eukprot:CFRG8458T1